MMLTLECGVILDGCFTFRGKGYFLLVGGMLLIAIEPDSLDGESEKKNEWRATIAARVFRGTLQECAAWMSDRVLEYRQALVASDVLAKVQDVLKKDCAGNVQTCCCMHGMLDKNDLRSLIGLPSVKEPDNG